MQYFARPGTRNMELPVLIVFLWAKSLGFQALASPQNHSKAAVVLRMAGYPRKQHEGRLELWREGEWGTVCDDGFSLKAAHVACRQLGYTEATGWTHSAHYGMGTGKIWLDEVMCRGLEESLADCRFPGWGQTDCTHEEDAGIVCSTKRRPGFPPPGMQLNTAPGETHLGEVRLQPVLPGQRNRQPPNEGWLEVRHPSGTWHQVCGQGWTQSEAQVACGMLGFPSSRLYNKLIYSIFSKRTTPSYLLFGVNCSGLESHLAACSHNPLQAHATNLCPGAGPVVVSCVLPGKSPTPDAVGVRLRGGALLGEGRIEVIIGGLWGTVCDRGWGMAAASIACRQLGFGTALEAAKSARMGQGIGPIHMTNVLCRGNERSLLSCFYGNASSSGCRHTDDAAIRCNTPNLDIVNQIRLVSGTTTYEGRVEVKQGNSWGTVCSTNWTTKDAMVVCRQLGLGYALHALKEVWYWAGSSDANEVVLSGLSCRGWEPSLLACPHDNLMTCKLGGSQHAAGVICVDTAPDLLINASLVQGSAYIEDRPLHMLDCAAEEGCLSESARYVPWPYGSRRLLRFSSQVMNLGRADFKPKMGRHSWLWHACHQHYHSMNIFTHYDILARNGSRVAEGHKASFCLEDSECAEGVRKRYECANFGNQGITVGCSDSYLHDIDCQWIDVTDVPPGDYIFQILINPEFEVSESDFTNNAMRCAAKYDGYRIFFQNCHIAESYSMEMERSMERYLVQIQKQGIANHVMDTMQGSSRAPKLTTQQPLSTWRATMTQETTLPMLEVLSTSNIVVTTTQNTTMTATANGAKITALSVTYRMRTRLASTTQGAEIRASPIIHRTVTRPSSITQRVTRSPSIARRIRLRTRVPTRRANPRNRLRKQRVRPNGRATKSTTTSRPRLAMRRVRPMTRSTTQEARPRTSRRKHRVRPNIWTKYKHRTRASLTAGRGRIRNSSKAGRHKNKRQ
uniref:Lysyl oxidase homolog n=1 Tax=Eptatretus burgeri TaxID=7764 RepID=A0A8C4N5V4_EPTBU